MKIEKLPSGSYRVRKMVNGRSYAKTFDHKPTQAEIFNAFNAQYKITPKSKRQIIFKQACDDYIDMKSNVLSVSTIRGYRSIVRNLSDIFANADISDIDANVVQREINAYASVHAPKSVRNYHGFISAVLSCFHPDLALNTTLPTKIEKQEYIPTSEDIKRIMEKAKGTRYELPFLLAMYGLRKSEVCAIDRSDLSIHADGTYTLSVNKALVQDEHQKWIIKSTKTLAGVRNVPISDYVANIIKEKDGRLYPYYPHSIYKALCRYQVALGIPHFRLHLMRHYFASMLHENGLPDAEIKKLGGWKSEDVLKKIYRHAMKEKEKEVNQKVIDILNI